MSEPRAAVSPGRPRGFLFVCYTALARGTQRGHCAMRRPLLPDELKSRLLAYVLTRDDYRVRLFLNVLFFATNHHDRRAFTARIPRQVQNIVEVDVEVVPSLVRAY